MTTDSPPVSTVLADLRSIALSDMAAMAAPVAVDMAVQRVLPVAEGAVAVRGGLFSSCI